MKNSILIQNYLTSGDQKMKNDENQNIVDIETLYKNKEEAVGLPK